MMLKRVACNFEASSAKSDKSLSQSTPRCVFRV